MGWGAGCCHWYGTSHTNTQGATGSFIEVQNLALPLPFRYVLFAVMLTLLVVEVGAMMTEFVQQTGTNGFLSNLTAVVIPTASVAYTLWCKSFSRPTATSSNGSFAFQPKTKFSSFMSKAIKSTSDNNLDWRSGYVRFDITNWGEGAIVEWTSCKRNYQLEKRVEKFLNE